MRDDRVRDDRVTRALVVRADSNGDVLLAGPAVRAVARRADVTLLVSPAGEQAARMLPAVGEVLVRPFGWSGYEPPPVDPADTADLVATLASLRFDAAVILTSFHQSPLPAALLLRLAGVGFVAATSEDYPGSLLDVRHRLAPDDDRHEVERSLDLVTAAGFPPDPGDPGAARLDVVTAPPPPALDLPARPFVAVHPGASVPARAPGPQHAARIVTALARAGWPVVVTGGPAEQGLTGHVTALAGAGRASDVHDLGGRTTLAELGGVLARAVCLVVGNTGPAHLAAAVGTPVVSLFAPVVSPAQWTPWGVPVVVLGDPTAACRGTRARQCPVPGHPCLSSIDPADVVRAVTEVVTRVGEELPA